VTLQVSSVTGFLPNAGEPSYGEVFVKGTEPKQRSSFVPTPAATLTREQVIATATAVSAYATAAAQGTPLPAGVSLTPPAIPTPEPSVSTTPLAGGTPVASGTPGAGGTPQPVATPSAVARPAGKVTVPNVAGLPQSQAESVLRAAGVAVGTIGYANPPGTTFALGSVISQSPSAGSQVESSTNVAIVIRR